MRRLLAVLAVTLVCVVAIVAQRPQRPPRHVRPSQHAQAAELAIKQAMEQLGNDKKGIERDIQVLGHIRTALAALGDPMQPTVALEKAFEQIGEAERFNQDFTVRQGLIRARQELEAARRSPATADMARLAMIVRFGALGPSSRLVVRNAARLQEEAAGWIAVQELIAGHLRVLNEVTGESLRASDEER